MNSFLNSLIAIAVLFFVVTMIGKCSPKDDTDPPEGRSGLSLKTDNLTGCQYLTTMTGITPRVDSSGRHICKTQK